MNQNRRRHCVVADDVRPYRELLRNWMVEWGYECTTAARAKEAWEAIQKRQTNVVITDIDMPEISGLHLIRAIRASEHVDQRAIPVIAISSMQDDDIDLLTQQVGAIRFIAKPLDKARFYTTLCSVMGLPPNPPQALDKHHSCPKSTETQARNVSPKLRRMLLDSHTSCFDRDDDD